MTRSELEKYILDTYGVAPDYPWISDPDSAVFRHGENQKWFALIMDIPKSRLGLSGEGKISVVNFKCDPILVSAIRTEAGFFPAYHMNKDKWITAALDGSAPDDSVKMLLDMSFCLTAKKKKR